MTHPYTLVQSKKKNRYFVDQKTKKITVCHPLLYHFLELKKNRIDVGEWISQLPPGGFEIPECGTFCSEEINYYYQKYLFLEQNGHFDSGEKEELSEVLLTADAVRYALANTNQVVFECTDRCGMKCKYCGYGEFYTDYDSRENKILDPETGKKILDFMTGLWNSPSYKSYQNKVFVSFYGGEPLLNFPFIKEIVTYSGNLPLVHNRIRFSMTTNAEFLDKYMDFLAEHDFNLLISLDGSEENNSYRVLQNGKPSFPKVLANVKLLQEKYPDYFKRKVNFNAVLHNKNSVSEIFHFFKTEFDKIPRIGALNTSGINPEHIETFKKTYVNVSESLYNSEDYSLIEKEMFIQLPNIQNISMFFNQCNSLHFNNYNHLLTKESNNLRFPTGTCIPFSQKIFITVNGKIMACERIGQHFGLGKIDENGITLDFDEIANRYNAWWAKLKKQCSACYNSEHCLQCIFYLDITGDNPVCNGFMTPEDHSKHIASYFNYLETKPGLYDEILRKVIIE